MTTSTPTKPRVCSCGVPMTLTPKGVYVCEHCDGNCHRRCDPDGCENPDAGKKCARCIAFAIGSRPKGSFGYVPPTYE